MQDVPGVHCGCGQPDWEADEQSCDGCGTTVPDSLAHTVDVSFDQSRAHEYRFCPPCFVRWRDRFEREMAPSSRDEDGGIIVA